MLPVCSAAPSCSSYYQLSCHVGTRAFYPFQKAIQERNFIEERLFLCIHDGVHGRESSSRLHAARCMNSLVVETPDDHGSYDSSILSPYNNDFDDIVRTFSKEYFDNDTQNPTNSSSEVIGLCPTSENLSESKFLSSKFSGTIEHNISNNLMDAPPRSSYAELPSTASPGGDELLNLPDSLGQGSTGLSASTSSGFTFAANSIPSISPEDSLPVSGSLERTNGDFPSLRQSFEDFFSGTSESVETSVARLEDTVRKAYDSFTFSISDAVESVKNSFDNAINGLFSTAYNTKEQAGSNLTGLSSELGENVYKASAFSIDVLRRTIFTVEDSLTNVSRYIVYFYGSAKSSLPPDVRDALNLSEDKITEIFRPFGSAAQQASKIIEEFEKNVGLDPSDPVVSFVLLLGVSATLGVSYWLLVYGGYSGDISPELTLELLKNEDGTVLIDVRPEALREKDGVPDLRRAARFRYASVVLPEIDNSLRKLLKGGKEIDDTLMATVIKNLKIVRDGSKIIVMDTNGSRAKSIARSLKKLGVKKPYLLQGGFQSWVKKGLRIKELKPESTLTVLNEEAEAILADVKPTPALVVGSALGLSAAFYALLEWEKTLQVIAIIGLGLTVYQRFASYEKSEDLKEDVKLLFSPFQRGAQAISWAAQKLEPNKIGLQTSPSSTAVQDRVLQAAAKHESQPSDSETENLPESASQASEA
ncbi:Rhodanese/Cell cycle control phosphatase protein [Dioscorea alata]|uniref:Rhodanese/Cell cycle control phosphatase protein n=2 Tax=Dioscorea alata TaxID=55571 RepID=A0ACB7WBI8_DIOAL|nr:Rhodanese/Cell cycle control phosphatase protein [Dioscorea alata]KAH7685096.1 Rhodanese/Cell cycle control phosphatase protein [Dioscorea alata]